jgi:hypothetical protein
LYDAKAVIQGHDGFLALAVGGELSRELSVALAHVLVGLGVGIVEALDVVEAVGLLADGVEAFDPGLVLMDGCRDPVGDVADLVVECPVGGEAVVGATFGRLLFEPARGVCGQGAEFFGVFAAPAERLGQCQPEERLAFGLVWQETVEIGVDGLGVDQVGRHRDRISWLLHGPVSHEMLNASLIRPRR